MFTKKPRSDSQTTVDILTKYRQAFRNILKFLQSDTSIVVDDVLKLIHQNEVSLVLKKLDSALVKDTREKPAALKELNSIIITPISESRLKLEAEQESLDNLKLLTQFLIIIYGSFEAEIGTIIENGMIGAAGINVNKRFQLDIKLKNYPNLVAAIVSSELNSTNKHSLLKWSLRELAKINFKPQSSLSSVEEESTPPSSPCSQLSSPSSPRQ